MKKVAIKKVKVFDKYQGLPQSFYREVEHLRQLNDNNIIKLNDVFVDNDMNTYLILEYCDYDLDKLIKSASSNGGLPLLTVKCYFKQLLSAVLKCHQNNIIHRDLKPSNVLVTRNNVVKLTDFGLSRKYSTSSKMTLDVVTPGYKAPEIILGDSNYSFQSDIWSLGAILFEMITGLKLFNPKSRSDASQLKAIIDILGKPQERDFPNNSNLKNFNLLQLCLDKENQLDAILREMLVGEYAEAIPLIERMLRYNPNERISIQDAINDPFLDDDYRNTLSPAKIPEITFEENYGIDDFSKTFNHATTSAFSSAETSPIRPLRVELTPFFA